MFSLRRLCDDLEKAGRLVRVEEEVDARLEAAEIQRRVYASGGPAVFYANVKGCRFPMVSNLFGTIERARYLFRHTYDAVRRAIELKIDPSRGLKEPLRYLSAPLTAWRMRPKLVRRGAVIENETTISQLPQLVCWPSDGGPFVTLPQCYTEDVNEPGLAKSNLGMYRIQLAGNQYLTDREIGLHYQTHRGIGVHHTAAIRAGQRLRVNVFVGGHPAMMLSAVMPLPEGMSELTFAGALAGERIAMIRAVGRDSVARHGDDPRREGRATESRPTGLPIYADADFCISGYVDPQAAKKPEGPFGDHLGYYSLAHDFPVLNVEHVYHRRGAVWPFTVVGRPPQEDTTFGQLIHELTGAVIPTVLHGVKEVHAVDAAGVHPLLLAIGSERYMPFVDNPRPQEILTQACAILGQGQLSLAKYLWIASRNDDEQLSTHDISGFFRHVLERIDWRRDLHFHTNTTIDTLDYSGQGLNMGSKVVLAAAGRPIRALPTEVPSELKLPAGFSEPRIALPGILVIRAPAIANLQLSISNLQLPDKSASLPGFCEFFTPADPICRFPLIVLVDDSDFAARNLNNFLWVAFTRSNPASDIGGIGPFTRDKHWGCEGSLVIDARVKPHHAPPLVEDPQISKKVDAMAARGGPLARWL